MKILRWQDEDVPEESFETAWREAKDLLHNAGPDAGFVLLIATKSDETYDSIFALSSGRHKIPPAHLAGMVEGWFSA